MIQSSSASPSGVKILQDVLPMYEGQSLIRPLIQEEEGRQDWQFTVMNTGGSWLAMRSAARPAFRLVVPLVIDLEWRFTDLDKDPNELRPIQHFSLMDLFEVIGEKYGDDGADWLRDAAHVAEWWVLDNWRRYGYSPAIEAKSGKSDYDPNVEYKAEHGDHSDGTSGVQEPASSSPSGTGHDEPVLPIDSKPPPSPPPPRQEGVDPRLDPDAGIEPFFSDFTS